MKINNNISTVITNKHLLRNENSLTQSMERLSSGLKINHVSDSPAGMAISGKMQAQIDGLDQASRNASDAISVLDTADGAMDAITAMLQRVRELAVQAANDINSPTERRAIQDEIDNLKEEVDRIAKTTEFNTKKLLDGSMDKRVYADGVSRVNVSDTVTEGMYKMQMTDAPYPAKIEVGLTAAALVGQSGSISINGQTAVIDPSMNATQIYESVRNAAESGGLILEDNITAPFTFTQKTYGPDSHVELTFSPSINPGNVIRSDRGTAVAATPAYNPDGSVSYWDTGENPIIVLDTGSDFTDKATVAYEDGTHVKITDENGFSIDFMLNDETIEEFWQTHAAKDIELEVTDIGLTDMQVGANALQQVGIRIPNITAKSLYLDKVDVTVSGGAAKAISQMDVAIAKVNAVRSKVGAYTNRLENTIKSLDATHENMNAAISRIMDTDMAEEMSEFTKFNVL